MNQKLKIITDKSGDGIFINNNSDLSYINEEGELVVVDELDSNDRPIYISELFSKLNSRKWNNAIRKSIIQGELYVQDLDLSRNLNTDDFIEFDTGVYIVDEDSELYKLTGAVPSVSNLNQLSKYNNIIESMNENGITLYNSSKITVDFINNSVSLDLMGNDEYTNTISLVGIEKRQSVENLSAKIDLTVSYTINNAIYRDDLTFEAFTYIEENSLPTLVRTDFISPISDGKILVEYIDGIIRVIPDSNNIDECIISNCIITYGNL